MQQFSSLGIRAAQTVYQHKSSSFNPTNLTFVHDAIERGIDWTSHFAFKAHTILLQSTSRTNRRTGVGALNHPSQRFHVAKIRAKIWLGSRLYLHARKYRKNGVYVVTSRHQQGSAPKDNFPRCRSGCVQSPFGWWRAVCFGHCLAGHRLTFLVSHYDRASYNGIRTYTSTFPWGGRKPCEGDGPTPEARAGETIMPLQTWGNLRARLNAFLLDSNSVDANGVQQRSQGGVVAQWLILMASS